MFVYTDTEIRIKNLLRFSVLLNDSTVYNNDGIYIGSESGSFSDVKLSMTSPDYIMEKFNKYIGFKPNVNEQTLLLFDTFKNKEIDTWIKNWGKPTDELKVILLFLTKVRPHRLDTLILEFEESIGNFNDITLELGTKLHALVEMKVIDKIISSNNNFWRKIVVEDKIDEIIENN